LGKRGSVDFHWTGVRRQYHGALRFFMFRPRKQCKFIVTLRLLAKSIIKHLGNLKRYLSRVPNLWPVFSVSLVIRKSNGNPFTTIC
jgi:hypothetical protein